MNRVIDITQGLFINIVMAISGGLKWSDMILGEDFERLYFLCVHQGDVSSLADAFADIVKIDNRPKGREFRIFNLGLDGRSGGGKTTFSDTVLHTDKTFKVTVNRDFNQFKGVANDFGQITRADAKACRIVNPESLEGALLKHWRRVAPIILPQGLHITEHAIFSGRYDYHALACIRREKNDARSFELFFSAPVAETEAFQRFKERASSLRYEP